MINVILAVRA